MFEFILRLAKDTHPELSGFQPQVLYIILCLLVPLLLGLAIGLFSNLILHFTNRKK